MSERPVSEGATGENAGSDPAARESEMETLRYPVGRFSRREDVTSDERQ